MSSQSSSTSNPAVSVTGNLQRLFSHVRVENLAAGLSAGVVSTMVLHPLDLVKIRFAGIAYHSYNAIKGYAKEGRQTELSAMEHLVSAAEAGQFWPYLVSMDTMAVGGSMSITKPNAGAGLQPAGAMTLCITNPIWVTKTRLVLQYNTDPGSKPYKGMVDALVKIYRQEGIPGLYRNPLEYITMAALSKIFAVATTYPYQVVRARLQDQHNTYLGVVDVIRRTWRNEGSLGFYKGMVPNLIRVTPACCITFVVYENVSRFLMGQHK
ncbi:hypothetical protein NFI96_003725 [Prochilodus magdalenae]|nr:hypothetical protein NFI96_003725 [Prochilodus magdalenae]